MKNNKELDLKDLYAIQEEIEQSKIEKARLEGEIQSIMKQLEENWGCKSVKQAEKKLIAFTNEIDTLEAEIKQEMEDFEQKYYAE